MAALPRPGWAELACALLALGCIVLPAWWADESNAEARRRELRATLQGRLAGGESRLNKWAQRRGVRARGVAARVEAAARREGLSDEALRERLAGAAREAGFNGATLKRAELLGTIEGLRLKGAPPVVPWNLVEPGPFDWRFAALAPLHGPEGEIRAVAAFESAGAGLAEAAGPQRSAGAVRLYHREAGWLRAGECQDPPAKTLLRAGVRPPGAERRHFNVTGYAGCSGEKVVGAWSEEPTLAVGVLAETPWTEAYRPLITVRRALFVAALLLGLLLLVLLALQTSSDPPANPEVRPRRRRSAAAWGILAVSLLATLVAWFSASARSDGYEKAAFESSIVALKDHLVELLQQPQRTVAAAAGALEALGPERLDDWASFLESLSERDRHWELCQVGFVPAGPGDAVVRALSEACGPDRCRDGGADCRLQQLRRAGLLDEALDRRLTADAPARAFPIADGPGEIALVRALETGGWIVGLIDVEALAEELAGRAGEGLSFQLIADSPGGEPTLLFDSAGAEERAARGEDDAMTLPVEIGGRSFTLRADRGESSTPHLASSYPAQVLLAGLAISVLLFDIALVLSSTRERALGIAELMTQRYRDGEERVRAVIDNAHDGIVTYDPQGVISTFNPAAERLFGRRKSEVSELRFRDLLPTFPEGSEDAERAGALVSARRKDGSRFPAEVSISAMRLAGKPYFTAVVRDISARVQAEEKLRESEERYALAARGANDGLWDWNLKTNQIYFSDRWKAMLGVGDQSIGSDPDEWFSRVHSADIADLRAKLTEHLAGRSPHFESEHRMRYGSGGYLWALSRGIAVRDASGAATRIAGSLTDITERKRTERRLRYDALHDPLTGLPNRTHFVGQLERARRRASQDRCSPFGLLFLDIDRFKVVNDSLGHLIGDQLLVAISERLKTCVRPGDTICRLGGDEFAILIEALESESDAMQVAERVQRELRRPLLAGRHEVFSSVSIGIAISSSGAEAPEELLRDADTAMYRAKSGGRARFELFEQPMHADALALLQLDTDLRRAVERNQLVLHYQPVVDLRTGRIVCCEALVRWRHPDWGLLPPDRFISVAEESGVIEELTGWLLRETCSQLIAWREAGLPPLAASVNISPRQLQRQDISRLVCGTLESFGLPPSALQLELTETALMEGSEASTRPLRELQKRGVRISLDDFGTGYSSLAYLRRFPIHAIKIDQSFIRQSADDDGSAAIVRGLIGLAHSLRLEVVAEGVESGAQLEYLIACDCDLVQGYVVSPAVEADKFAELLAAGVEIDVLLERPRMAG